MSQEKSQTATQTTSTGSETEVADDIDIEENVDSSHKAKLNLGSNADLRDMTRLGRRQQFSRNFGFLSIVGFSTIAMGTWQQQLGANLGRAADGGLANLVWSYLFVFLCWCAVVASMAEMASMAPAAGAQYHWVSEFAPPSVSRLFSFLTGWVDVLSWQAAFASVSIGACGNIQSLLTLTGSTVVFDPWQTALVVIATCLVAVLFNANIANSLPLIGGAMVLLYICGFFAILIPLWVLAPRTDINEVFTNFSDMGDSFGLTHSLLFGIFFPLFSLMAPDTVSHMSEEIKDASIVMPRAMMVSTVINGVLGFIALVSFCFTVGDIKAVYSSDFGASLQVFLNTTNSTAATVIMSLILTILSIGGGVTVLTSASRLLFALARDKGTPFAPFFSYVRPGWRVPLNAIIFTFAFSVVLTLLNVASPIVTGTFFDIALSGNISSYVASIGCVRLKRWRNEPLPSHRWNLGRWGAPINDIAILFLLYTFVIFCTPSSYVVTPSNMNYNSVVWVGILVLSLVYYYTKGKNVYTEPSSLLRKID